MEITWTNVTTTGVDLDAAGSDRIRQRAGDGDVRSSDLPDDSKSSSAFEPAKPGTTAAVAIRGGDLNPTVLIEFRPVDGGASVLGEREPLIDAVVIDRRRAERFESVRFGLRANVEFNRSMAGVPAD